MTNKEKIRNRLSDMNQKDLDKLSDEQLEFIVHSLEESCFLKACPGSGKTEVVGIKAAFEIANWDDAFSGISILSFTKNAAKEISDRVAKYNGINATKHPHYIGTIDAWLHSYLLHPFGHKHSQYQGKEGDKSFRLVDNIRYDFLTHFQTEHSTTDGKPNPIEVNDYNFNCKKELESNSHDFTKFDCNKKTKLTESKDKFLKAGLATYQDAEYICYQLLKNNETILANLAKRFQKIVVDE